jgi:hypothetical protein
MPLHLFLLHLRLLLVLQPPVLTLLLKLLLPWRPRRLLPR